MTELHTISPRPLDAELLCCLPIFPLAGATMFPGALLPLHLFEPRYRALAEYCVRGPAALAVASPLPSPDQDYFGRPPVSPVMGVGALVAHRHLEDGRWDVALRGIGRVRLVAELAPSELFRLVQAEVVPDVVGAGDQALAVTLRKLCLQVAQRVPAGTQQLDALLSPQTAPGPLSDLVAHSFVASRKLRQSLLEEVRVTRRLELLVDALGTLLLKLSFG